MLKQPNWLDAINNDPDNDNLRLVYSDYLEEQGELIRAEFIRVQVALANTSMDDRHYDLLAQREQQLLTAHWDRWRKEVSNTPAIHPGKPRRGFIEEVVIYAPAEEDYFEYPELMSFNWPDVKRFIEETFASFAVRRYHLNNLHDTDFREIVRTLGWTNIKELALSSQFSVNPFVDALSLPQASDLERLDLRPLRMSQDQLMVLLAGPHMDLVHSLDLTNGSISADVVSVLAAEPLFRKLESLRIGESGHHEGDRIGNDGIRALAESPYLENLHTLECYNSRITDSGATALANSSGLANLRQLTLRGNKLGETGVKALAASPYLHHLVRLDLSLTELSGTGLKTLAASPTFANVRSLNIGGNRIGDAATLALATAEHWRLSHLSMNGVDITDEGADTLVRSPSLEELLTLQLSGNKQLGANGLRSLLSSPVLKSLQLLSVASCKLTADDFKPLADSNGLPQLYELDMRNNDMGDTGAVSLAQWPGLSSVRVLRLNSCSLGHTGAKALLDSPHLQPGVNLQLFGNDEIPETTIRELREKFGEGVWWSDGSDYY